MYLSKPLPRPWTNEILEVSWTRVQNQELPENIKGGQVPHQKSKNLLYVFPFNILITFMPF